MRPRASAATILLLAAALSLAWAYVVLLSGGFTVGALVSRDPVRPLIVSAILAAIARVLSPLDFDATLARLAGPRIGWPARAAMVAAASVFVVATAWNTRAAGGSDSSCYVLQADAFANGRATLAHPLAGVLADAPPAMFAPTGFIPSPREPLAAVPICAPGLALVMAVVRPAGAGAVFLVVPLCAALTVWTTFAFGRRAADALTGAVAACLLACSPIFLYQSVQPMSDVPATCFWLAAITATARADRGGQYAGGICASLAVLTRPNLVLAILPLVALLPDRRAWLRWGLAALPGALALAWLNAIRYGSPVATGYGHTGALFSSTHVIANAARYGRWFVDTETVVPALALAAPWVMRGDRARVRLAIVALAASALILTTYLAYTVFDDWWYVRFLLPMLPVAIVYAVAVFLRAFPARGRALAAVAAACLFGALGVRAAIARQAFDLQSLESRFVLTGGYAARASAETVFIAGQETGSIRFHGGRPTLAWDAIPPDGLDRLVAELRRHGSRVIVALEDAETAPFRQRFAAQNLGALDWRPSGEVRARVRVQLWDTAASAVGPR